MSVYIFLKKAVTEYDGQLCQRLVPVVDRFIPFGNDGLLYQEQQLHQRILTLEGTFLVLACNEVNAKRVVTSHLEIILSE